MVGSGPSSEEQHPQSERSECFRSSTGYPKPRTFCSGEAVSAPSAYPLAWPTHRARRPWSARVRGDFSEKVETKTRLVTLDTACDRLEAEVRRLGGIYPLISTNVELRMDGRPRRDRAMPADPAVCVYFQLAGKPYALACDTYTEVAQNIAAVANHIDTLRRQERYGVATAAESLQAFMALPAPSPTSLGLLRHWWEVLGVPIRPALSEVETAYRKLAAERHPDAGGSDAAMAELNAARDAARKALA